MHEKDSVNILVDRIVRLESENAALRTELDERRMCLCIPMDRLHFDDPYFNHLKSKMAPEDIIKQLKKMQIVI